MKDFAHGVTVECLLKTYEADAEGNSNMLGDIGMTRDPAGSFRVKPPGHAEPNSCPSSERSVFQLAIVSSNVRVIGCSAEPGS